MKFLGQTPLSFLLGSYFHQDFNELTGSPEQTTQCFLDENPNLAVGLADQIQAILRQEPNETELKKLVDSMYGYYLADWDGGTYRGWFASIEAQARAFASEHPEADG